MCPELASTAAKEAGFLSPVLSCSGVTAEEEAADDIRHARSSVLHAITPGMLSGVKLHHDDGDSNDE